MPSRSCVLQYVQSVAVCCSMLQYVAVCCSVLQRATKQELLIIMKRTPSDSEHPHAQQIMCVAVCCSMLQYVAVCCSVLQRATKRRMLKQMKRTPSNSAHPHAQQIMFLQTNQYFAIYRHLLKTKKQTVHKSISIKKARGTLDLSQTSRANPVQCYSTHQAFYRHLLKTKKPINLCIPLSVKCVINI